MIINLLIDEPTAKIMQYYGDISEVVNKILEHGARGDIPLMDLPPAPQPLPGTKQYKINVTDLNYLKLCDIYGTKSQRISLRRIVYWFMDNEKYIDFEWTSDKSNYDEGKQELLNVLAEVESSLYKLYKITRSKHALIIKSEMDLLRNEVWDA